MTEPSPPECTTCADANVETITPPILLYYSIISGL